MIKIEENFKEYMKMKKTSDEIIKMYRKNVEKNNQTRKKQVEIRNYAFPHIANFEDDDYIINLMGINPNSDSSPIEPYESKMLDLYYTYGISKEYTCENPQYVTSQYNFWNKEEYKIFENKVKMSWEKYDEKFLKKFYNEELGKKYYEIIKEIRNQDSYKEMEFEDNKYFIFTDLYYITGRPQQEIEMDIDKKIYNKIRELFYKQLKYYKTNLTIVANESASKIVLDNIIRKEKEKWQRVILEGDEKYKEYTNVYRLKDTDSYVYLSTRYFDKMGITLRKTFSKEIRKILNGDIIEIEDL